MSKVEITDEMVDRAIKIYGPRNGWTPPTDSMDDFRHVMRRAIEAALNPPAEPEIPVSVAVKKAGFDEVVRLSAYNRDAISHWNTIPPTSPPRMYEIDLDDVLLIYRAMEAKRRDESLKAELKAAEFSQLCQQTVNQSNYRTHHRSKDCRSHWHSREGDRT